MMKQLFENNNYPLVSIIIPTYNCERHILESVESSLVQSYPNLEIIVIDDGSTDNTEQILKPYFDRIKYIRKTNSGLAGARNVGIGIANGEYLAWLDSDDIAHPDRILIQAAYFSSHPDVVLVSSDFTAFDRSGLLEDYHLDKYYGLLKEAGGIKKIYPEQEKFAVRSGLGAEKPVLGEFDVVKGDMHHTLFFGNIIHPPTVMIRKSACLTAGEMDETVPTAEDWDYFYAISKQGKIACIDYPLIRYRISQSQMSSPLNNPEKIVTNIIRVMMKNIIEEPEFAQQNRKRINKILASYHATAAYVFSESKPMLALSYLIKSLQYNYKNPRVVKILAKIFVPNFFLAVYRNRKGE